MSVPDLLREEARGLLDRAHVPYSRSPAAAVVLLSDGSVVPGVRVENASFSLTITPAHAAVAAAIALGRRDISAVAVVPEPTPSERLYLTSLPFAALSAAPEADLFSIDGPLPAPVGILPLEGAPSTAADLAMAARRASERAFAPESDFRVGCVAVGGDGRMTTGVNVEHPDWSHVLCAERVALAAARAYGLAPIVQIAISCNGGSGCAPCGACRQVLQELAPDAVLWMDRDGSAPARTALPALLPGAFSGSDVLG